MNHTQPQPNGLALALNRLTNDGETVVQFLIQVMDDDLGDQTPTPTQRLRASRMLSNLGFGPPDPQARPDSPETPADDAQDSPDPPADAAQDNPEPPAQPEPDRRITIHNTSFHVTHVEMPVIRDLVVELTNQGGTIAAFLTCAARGHYPSFTVEHRMQAVWEILRRSASIPALRPTPPDAPNTPDYPGSQRSLADDVRQIIQRHNSYHGSPSSQDNTPEQSTNHDSPSSQDNTPQQPTPTTSNSESPTLNPQLPIHSPPSTTNSVQKTTLTIPTSKFQIPNSLPSILKMPPEQQEEAVARIENMSESTQRRTRYDWTFWARHNQLPPPEPWNNWLLLAGRGFGKTRAGAEWVRHMVESGRARRIALVARTPDDARRVMIEGESGLLSICPPWSRPTYQPSKRLLTWPNGAIAQVFSSHQPDQMRGPQFDAAWCDELASWKYPQQSWDNLSLALRLGDSPKCVVTTTPKRVTLLRQLIDRDDVLVTRGSTYDNCASLPASFLSQIENNYGSTRTGRQEIYAEMLDEADGATWRRDWIESARITAAPDLARIVVAIDPAVSSAPGGAETGIIVAGLDDDGHLHVIADHSGRMTPNAWARRAIWAFDRYGADRVIAESNNGGEMVRLTLRTADQDRSVPFKPVNASRGKRARAEPVAALYEQGRVHHVGAFPQLEDQMCGWTAGSGEPSDRIDALAWAINELMPSRHTPMLY